MIQDIAPHKLENHYVPDKVTTPDSPVVCFSAGQVLLRPDALGDLSFLPTVSDFPEGTAFQYLFTYDGVDLFLTNTPTDLEGIEFAHLGDIRRLAMLEKHQVFLLMTALQLNNWYKDNLFCGRCGKPTIHHPKERALTCPECHRNIYPRILPAVIVAVTYNGKILLTKYAPISGHDFPFYALVAGFVEIGETLEECVQREVMEETGLAVKNIRYYKSQPWGIVDDLLMGFYCEVDLEAQEALLNDELPHPLAMQAKLARDNDRSLYDENGDPKVRLDPNELRTGVWLTPEEMTLQPDAYSLTNEMMLLFKAEKVHEPTELPLPYTREDIELLEEEFYE